MADNTPIEWTDATWTPIRARNKATGTVGWHCEHASPGCVNCYSEVFNEKRFGTGLPFKPGHRDDVEHFIDERMLLQPLRWRRPRMVFVCSMTDLFGEWVPDEWIDRVFAVMALAPQHTFQVLTKRAERMRDYLAGDAAERLSDRMFASQPGRPEPAARTRIARNALRLTDGKPQPLNVAWPLSNVWLGISAEDQRRADERVPRLLQTPAAVRWVSAEPLLGPIDFETIWLRRDGSRPTDLSRALGDYVRPLSGNFTDSPKLDWIVAGGESGPGARPMHPDWVRSIRDQCAAADVPFLMKQWGAWAACAASDGDWPTDLDGFIRLDPSGDRTADGWPMQRVGKKAAGRILDGVTHDGFPSGEEVPFS